MKKQKYKRIILLGISSLDPLLSIIKQKVFESKESYLDVFYLLLNTKF